MKPRVLVTLGYYLPGFKSGGPLRSIVNLVEHLGGDYDFRILTGDRDLGDGAPYDGVPIDRWYPVGGAEVLHASPTSQRAGAIARLIAATPHDLLYVNSMLSRPFGLYPLLARRAGRIPRRPLVIAPRGVFSPGALSLKPWRKKGFLGMTRAGGLYREALWQASSDHEAEDTRRAMGRGAAVHVASDLPLPPMTDAVADGAEDGAKTGGPGNALRVVFLARIAPMKNLDFALEALARVGVPVRFSIYGPAEDPAYWQRCQALIAALPEHVTAEHLGPVHPAEVPAILARHDLMFQPSLGENFGHSIAEALAVGTPVLISDRTPWRGLAAAGVGHDLALDDPAPFAAAIEATAAGAAEDGSLADRQRRRAAVRAGYARLARIEEHVQANRDLFETAMKRHGGR